MSIKHLHSGQRAFTIIELLVTIAIVGILATITLPSMSRFVVNMRVDNEISELYRLLLTARNTAINAHSNVVICPLVNNACVNQWDRDISVFVDYNNNGSLETGAAVPEYVVRVKSAINNGDRLQYAIASLSYNPAGNIIGNVPVTTFNYCPKGYTDASQGILVTALGRAYITVDAGNGAGHRDRNNAAITCI